MVQYMNNSGFNQWNAMREKDNAKPRFGFFTWLLMFLAAWWLIGLFVPSKQDQIKTITPVVIEQSKIAARTLNTEDISFNVQGLRISKVKLNKHKQDTKSDGNVSLLSDENNFVEIGFVSQNIQTPNINTHWEMKSGEMHWDNPNTHFARKISVNGYLINVIDIIKNKTNHEISVTPYSLITQSAHNQSSSVVETGGVIYANKDLDYANWNQLNKKSFAYSTVRGFIGFADQYWETILSIDANDQTISLKKSGDLYFAQTNAAPVKIAPKSETKINTYIFAGPRSSDALKNAENFIPGINETIDYGWFWFFAQPMLWMLNWLFALVGNYGIAIILMTLIVRLLIWPLTRKSYVSTMMMQKMQPEMQRVQKLYANDKARLQMEMMKIYQTHKTSPMSGCLPMLIQIPIFFALYKALLISVPMRSAHFLWISDLAVMDPYFILPIVMGLTMWLQQYLQTPTKATGNDAMASTQRVMKWMPVLFTVMFAWMPAGLVLYWTVSNLFGILQMYIIKKTTK